MNRSRAVGDYRARPADPSVSFGPLFDTAEPQRTAATLEQLERVIEGGLQTFVEVGLALLDIRDRRLYRQSHTTFEDYCKSRWQLERTRAYELMQAARVATLVSEISDTPVLRESHAAALAPLAETPTLAAEAWEEAVAAAPVRDDGIRRFTAADVREAVERRSETPHVAQNTGENEWYTPPDYLEAARVVMGSIDVDPASARKANERVGATVFYDAGQNGLLQAWHGNVWMNPPYAQPLISQFASALVEKFSAGEVDQACVLVNNATETAWCQRLLAAASALCFVRGRVRFLTPDDVPGAPLQGQLVLYLGGRPEAFNEHFMRFGQVWRAQ